ncbi:MAG: hypothetical protein WBG18_24045 [Xanthobacteraceae bacterium]
MALLKKVRTMSSNATCGGSGFVPDDDNDEEVTRTASEKLRSKLPGIRPAELR